MSGDDEGGKPGVRWIDVNADLGEGCANDRALLELVTSASISCGAHAGTPSGIMDTLREAARMGIAIGAHPGYADREGFGRRTQNLTLDEVVELVRTQVAGLKGWAAEVGATITYLKPHGALYNQAQREPVCGRAVVLAARLAGWPLLGQPRGVVEALASECGVRFVPEGFPDRRYREDGTLVSRSEANAMLHEAGEVEEQVLRMVREGRVATLCIHGDEPEAVANATLVRRILASHGIGVRSFVDESR